MVLLFEDPYQGNKFKTNKQDTMNRDFNTRYFSRNGSRFISDSEIEDMEKGVEYFNKQGRFEERPNDLTALFGRGTRKNAKEFINYKGRSFLKEDLENELAKVLGVHSVIINNQTI